MIYKEIEKDLFTVPEDYYLAHCISSDAKMGAGIAVAFREKFNLEHLREEANEKPLLVGECIKSGRVLNLITKKQYWSKPTYKTFATAVKSMREVALDNGIDKIAMPQIGAGLDKLNWYKNRQIISRVFGETDIEILVCKYK